MRISSRAALCGIASAVLVLASAGGATADTITTSSDEATFDKATMTFTLTVGQTATATVTYDEDDTGKSGCDLTGKDSQVTYDTASSVAGVVSDLPASIQFTECGDDEEPPVQEVSFAGAEVGTTVVSFAVSSFTSNGKGVSEKTFGTGPASFTVVVVDDPDGRDAPAIANDYLHNVADDATVAACTVANGTNSNLSYWHGQLINKIAQFFEGQTFAPDQEYIVIDKVLEYCEVPGTAS
jgi:hypothetical protein